MTPGERVVGLAERLERLPVRSMTMCDEKRAIAAELRAMAAEPKDALLRQTEAERDHAMLKAEQAESALSEARGLVARWRAASESHWGDAANTSEAREGVGNADSA